MSTFVKSLVVVVILLLLLIVTAIQFISTDDILNKVSEEVTAATGRSLLVDGERSLRFFPSLSLDLNDVRFANAEHGSRADMVKVAKVMIHIPWMSVFTGELTIEKFVIHDPDILLEKNAAGQVNWQFFSDSKAAVSLPETTLPSVQETPNSPTVLPERVDVTLGQVEIIGGKLTYIDKTTKQSQTLDQLRLAIKLPSLRKALSISGSVRYMGQVFNLTTEVTTPADAINNKPFLLSLKLVSELINLQYDGKILEQGKEIQGSLVINGNSVKQLLSWQALPLTAKEEAFNQFELSTSMKFANNKLNFNDLKVSLDQLDFTGKSAITLSDPLSISAVIDLGILNLNPYLPEPLDKAANDPKVSPASENQPLVWDDTALDLSALSLLNADISIQSTQLMIREVKLGKNQFRFKLNQGKADIELKDFQAYQGTGVGDIHINATKKPYHFTSQFKLTGIDAEPLLTDAAGFDKLLGKGQLGWQLKTQGSSQKDLVHALNGDLNFGFIDGAIKGVNLGAIARSAENLIKGDLKAVSLDTDFSHAEKTDFASLSGNFTLTNGVANTTNLALINPFVRVTGTGDVNLPKTDLKLLVKTKLVASAQGQMATEEGSGLVIPIKISGPFHQIKIKPDVSSGAKEELKDKLKDKLKNLFGGH